MDHALIPEMKGCSEEKLVITIGRQFGSGGREFGQRLAETLGIGFYDKALLNCAAEKAGLNHEFFERNDERTPGFFNGLFSFAMGYAPISYYSGATAISGDGIYTAQSDFIRQLAREESCVIVGRTADYVLRDKQKLVSIFVHAPMEACVERILSRNPDMTAQQATHEAERINKLRAAYYDFYTDKSWGKASSYDLTLNTSLLPMDKLVELVVSYIKMRFGG